MTISPHLIETASWRLLTEIARRHPGRFRIAEMHPIAFMYDCLALIEPRDGEEYHHILYLNRNGSMKQYGYAGGEPCDKDPEPIWPDAIGAERIREVVDRLCKKVRVKIPKQLPPATPDIIVYRVISTWLTQAVFGRDRWECVQGFCDGGGVREHFEAFPGMPERLEVNDALDIGGEPAMRMWFLIRDHEPQLGIELNGTLWRRDGRAYDLVELYRKHGRITPTLMDVGSDLLP